MNPVAAVIYNHLQELAARHNVPISSDRLLDFDDACVAAGQHIDYKTMNLKFDEIIIVVYQLFDKLNLDKVRAEHVQYIYPHPDGPLEWLHQTSEREPQALTVNFEDELAFYRGDHPANIVPTRFTPPGFVIAYLLRPYRQEIQRAAS